jgi:hypothetical protein
MIRPSISLILSFIVLLGLLTEPSQTSSPLVPPPQTIPETFFGLHIHHAGSATPWPAVPMGAWRLWDAYVAWPNLEPRKGQWHFEVLDKYLDLARQHKVSVLLPLGLSPAWASARPLEPSVYQPGFAAEPKDVEDWREFVRAVATRYKGRIEAYEIWNEPNLKHFWTGNVDQMLLLTREASQIIRSIDPQATVVSPSATDSSGIGWLSEFLSKGGGQYVDVIGYHFYVFPKPPEDMVSQIQQVKRVAADNAAANKPLWNTETGWAYPKPFPSEELAAAYLARAYVLNWAAGVQRCYWYSWDNHGWVSIETTEKDNQTLRAAGKAYEIVHEWLQGARLEECHRDQNQTWICQVNRAGYVQWIVWNPDGATPLVAPNSWHAKMVVPLLGEPAALTGSTFDVGPLPTLVTSDRH